MARSHKKTRRGKRAGGKPCAFHGWEDRETGKGIIYDKKKTCSNFYKDNLTPKEQESLGGVIPVKVNNCNNILYWMGSEHTPTFYYCRNGPNTNGQCRDKSLTGRGVCNNNFDLQTEYLRRKLEPTRRLSNKQVEQLLSAEQAKIEAAAARDEALKQRLVDLRSGGKSRRPKKTRRRSRKHRVKSRRRR